MRQIKEFLGPWLATAGVYSAHIACLVAITAVTLMLLWAATDVATSTDRANRYLTRTRKPDKLVPVGWEQARREQGDKQ